MLAPLSQHASSQKYHGRKKVQQYPHRRLARVHQSLSFRVVFSCTAYAAEITESSTRLDPLCRSGHTVRMGVRVWLCMPVGESKDHEEKPTHRRIRLLAQKQFDEGFCKETRG